VCIGGLKLGFGSFQQPQAGFMPFLAGLLLGFLALLDLASGFMDRWTEEINWGKLILTMGLLFVYTFLSSTLGFIIGTILLFLYLFRMMEPRPWWIVLLASLTTTGLFYLVFQIGLESQLPRGFWGF
jgi:hypothetical protein